MFEKRRRFVEALHPADGLLDGGIEVLDADREPVESELGEVGDTFGTRPARIDFDRVFAMWIEIEGIAQPADQPREIFLGQKRRRAAAPVHPRNLALAAQRRPDQLDLAFDGRCIAVRPRSIPGRDLVAGAVETQRVAEWHVEIQSKGWRKTTDVALPKVMAVGTVIERFDETVGGRIRCVARAVASVFADQRGVRHERGRARDRSIRRANEFGNHAETMRWTEDG